MSKSIIIPNSHVPYNGPKKWSCKHYDAHYNKYVKPVFDLIRKRVDEIAASQLHNLVPHQVPHERILWNKCRYFEMTCNNEKAMNIVSKLTGVKVQYDNMLIGNRKQLHKLVKAFNKQGIYCDITQNWI